MTRLNQLAPRTTMASRHRARSAAHDPAREARIRRSFDGVVASYVRELWAANDTMRGRERGVSSIERPALRRFESLPGSRSSRKATLEQ